MRLGPMQLRCQAQGTRPLVNVTFTARMTVLSIVFLSTIHHFEVKKDGC